MNLIINDNTIYKIDTDTLAITQPPEKCHNCKKLTKLRIADACDTADCDEMEALNG